MQSLTPRFRTPLAVSLIAGAALLVPLGFAHAPTAQAVGYVSAKGTGTASAPNFKASPIPAGCTADGYTENSNPDDPDQCIFTALPRIVASTNWAVSQNPEASGAKFAIASGQWSAPKRVKAVRFDPDTTFGSCGSTTIAVYSLEGKKLWSAAPDTCGWVSIPASIYNDGADRKLFRSAVS